ncbi:hypothetical protein GCM10017687_82050 [Streptomyces echinatus]
MRVSRTCFLRDEDGGAWDWSPAAPSSPHTRRLVVQRPTRLQDIPLDRGPFTSSTSILGEAEAAMRTRTLDVSPVIDEHGYALGVLALTP